MGEVELVGDSGEFAWGVHREVGGLREVLAQQWSGPRKVDLGIQPYAAVAGWARYSSGLR